MDRFTAPLTVTKVADMIWMTENPFEFLTDNDCIIVRECFHTDFASIPRIFWSILPPDGQYTQAAVMHDYLYQNALRDRAYCDLLFLRGMVVLGIPKWKRQIMYLFVRLFGSSAYGRVKNG